MRRILAFAALTALTLCGADVTGTWKGTAETQNGTIERTFVFKVDGTKLTGETESSRFGKAPIMDGKIDGDNLSFTVTANFQGNEAKISYKGKVSSDGKEIKLSAEIPNIGQTIEYTAKRTQ